MRHLRSVCYALVLAPTTWTLSAVAFTQELTGRARAEGSVEVFTGFLLLLLAGAAYAILLLPRFSPVGPLTTGVIFLAACLWVLIDPGSFEGLFAPEVRKPGFDLTLPAHGLAALLAVPLLCTALSRRRWRTSRFEPIGADTGTIIWPFARPARPGTLVVPGVTGVPTSDATQVLHLGEPPVSSPGDRTQVISELPSSGDTTRPVVPAADATQTLPPADATQTLPPADATQTLPPADAARPVPSPADATQVLPPAGVTQALAPAEATQFVAPTDARPAAEATQVLPPVPVQAAEAPPRIRPTDPESDSDPDPDPDLTVHATSAGDTAVEAVVPTSAGPGGPLPADDTSPDRADDTSSDRADDTSSDRADDTSSDRADDTGAGGGTTDQIDEPRESSPPDAPGRSDETEQVEAGRTTDGGTGATRPAEPTVAAPVATESAPPTDLDTDGDTIAGSGQPTDKAPEDTTRLPGASATPTTPAPRREDADSADVTRRL